MIHVETHFLTIVGTDFVHLKVEFEKKFALQTFLIRKRTPFETCFADDKNRKLVILFSD